MTMKSNEMIFSSQCNENHGIHDVRLSIITVVVELGKIIFKK